MLSARQDTRRVLFVCTGNICRSPSAKVILETMAGAADLGERFVFDSAGLGRWHIGEPPDPRAVEAAARRGYDLRGLRARQVEEDDFRRFDLILGMDRGHHNQLMARCPEGIADRLRLFLEFAPSELRTLDVPDPYYGGDADFETMLDLIEAGGRGLLAALSSGHNLKS